MEVISFFIHAYLYIFIYEFLMEKKHTLRWMFVILIVGAKYITEYIVYMVYLTPIAVLSLLICYGLTIGNSDSYLSNLKYSVATYGIDYVISTMMGSTFGFFSAMTGCLKGVKTYFVLCIGRIIVLLVFSICKGKKKMERFRQPWVVYIGVMATVILLFAEQIIRLAFTTEKYGYINVAVTCIYLVILFTVLWLLDHYKMVKIQNEYAADNKQMSQKLHRSKEILPMIANYVSNMDGAPDDAMRQKLEVICHDYGKELGGQEMVAELFDTTGIEVVDLYLRSKIVECSKQDIELNVFVRSRIDDDMKWLGISDGEIARIFGDLLGNAINAVSDTADKVILVIVARDAQGHALIQIFDSGVAFPKEILKRFGRRGNTTWGTGNGIADLMESVNRVNASVRVSPLTEPDDIFTKEILICFDDLGNLDIRGLEE